MFKIFMCNYIKNGKNVLTLLCVKCGKRIIGKIIVYLNLKWYNINIFLKNA